MAEMVGSGSKGVGVRLFVEGGELVRKTFDQIGDSGKKMWAELGAGTKQANPALKGVNAIADEGKQAIAGLADQAGGLGRALSAVGPLGVAAAAAMGGLAIAINRAREAMTWAADLTDQAEQLGVTTEALQAYRFAAEDVGASAGAMESSLGSLNKAIGAIRTGVGDGKVVEALQAIGFTPEQIASLESADQLLLAVADKIAETGDIAEATKIADALGIDRELIPALMRGSTALTDATEKARNLGLVMGDDLVAGLDAANREVEIANQRIGMEMRRAFVELAPAIAGTTSALADFLGWARQTANDPGFQTLMSYLVPGGADLRRGMRRIRDQAAMAARVGTTDESSVASNYDLSGLSVNTPRLTTVAPPVRSGGGGVRAGGGSSARPAGIKAERYDRIEIVSAEEISRMQLALQLETARIAKNEQLIAALERELELRELIDRYTKMGLSEDDARTSAELTQWQRDQARFADMSGFTANRADELRASFDALEETRQARIDDMRQVWREGARAAVAGDFKEWLADQIGQAWLKGLDDVSGQLFDLLFNIIGGGSGAFGMSGTGSGSGGFDWLGAIGSVFGLGGGSSGWGSPGSPGFGGGGGTAKIELTSKMAVPEGYVPDAKLQQMFAATHESAIQKAVEMVRERNPDMTIEHRLLRG
ncbi:hypothetical protein [Brevundimonas sp.]|uniref:hypothetical protein n=1 Tax=Brevundimonas sp. TaxID=1871086 RepID=UPI002D4EE450|nr:hypothetical protein [Brevundimonas sp.]HYD26967.1 hypothetical protein [Brevundimonas sp.]